jgi:L-threonylcarbamoyladenylate synthase
VVGPVKYYHSSSSQLPTPGLAPRHYAPATETLLCERDLIKTIYDNETVVLVFSTAIPSIELESQFVLSETGSLAEAAKNLYQLLHTLDEKGFKKIICEQFPDSGIGVAINDRLRRASTRDNQLNNL